MPDSEIEIDFFNVAEDSQLSTLLLRAVDEISEGERRTPGQLSIVITDDEKLRELNKKWLEIDEPTDVLSFDLGAEAKNSIDGEVYISLDRAGIQASEREENTEREIIRLLIHGVLHICGYDHNDDVSLREMIMRGESYVDMVFR